MKPKVWLVDFSKIPSYKGKMEIELNVSFVVVEGMTWREALFIILDFVTSKWKKVKRKHSIKT